MKIVDFKFNEDYVKVDFLHDNNIVKKIRYSLDYLIKHLPVNHLKKDNSFNFNKLKFDEGKNYNWYFLTNEKTTILIRQYRTHFTFFVQRNFHEYFIKKLSVFTITDNFDKMDGDTNDAYCDDNFKSIREYLPELVKKIEENKTHTLWNDHSFKVPKHVDVKIGMIGSDRVDSLDLVIFACDELFSKYIEVQSENEVLEQIKKYKVGDKLGDSYTITKVKTKLKNDYYHSCGLEFTNDNFPDSEPKWADVYSLASYYSKDLDK